MLFCLIHYLNWIYFSKIDLYTNSCVFIFQVSSGLQPFAKTNQLTPLVPDGRYAQQAAAEAFLPVAAAARR